MAISAITISLVPLTAEGAAVSERESAKAVLGSSQPAGYAPSGSPSRSETTADSAPGGVGAPSGDSGAQRVLPRVARADYIVGGDARARYGRSLAAHLRVTRRGCASARRGLAYNCAAISEREHPVVQQSVFPQRAVGPAMAEVLAEEVSRSEVCRAVRKAVRFYSRRYADWRAKMGREVNRRVHAPDPVSCPRYLLTLTKRKARAARLEFERWFERTYEKWRCIHEHEGAWNDPDPPHYGGLQFDDSFQRTYGPEFFRRWGDAGNWPVYAQLIAAERAWRVRAFSPWPNTARLCGLL